MCILQNVFFIGRLLSIHIKGLPVVLPLLELREFNFQSFPPSANPHCLLGLMDRLLSRPWDLSPLHCLCLCSDSLLHSFNFNTAVKVAGCVQPLLARDTPSSGHTAYSPWVCFSDFNVHKPPRVWLKHRFRFRFRGSGQATAVGNPRVQEGGSREV